MILDSWALNILLESGDVKAPEKHSRKQAINESDAEGIVTILSEAGINEYTLSQTKDRLVIAEWGNNRLIYDPFRKIYRLNDNIRATGYNETFKSLTSLR